jgi:hypothetical protein
LLHLVGYLYYWQMGFKSVFKGLISGTRKYILAIRVKTKVYLYDDRIISHFA